MRNSMDRTPGMVIEIICGDDIDAKASVTDERLAEVVRDCCAGYNEEAKKASRTLDAIRAEIMAIVDEALKRGLRVDGHQELSDGTDRLESYHSIIMTKTVTL